MPTTIQWPNNASLKLLLVEDTDSERIYLSELLNQQGFQVTECSNGIEALALYEQNDFDIVLSDWRMPGMSGLELCRQLKTRDLPPYVLMLTGNTETDDLIQGIESGADDYLGKPFLPSVLKVRLLAAVRLVALNHKLREQYHALQQSLQHEQSLRTRLQEELQSAAALQQSLLPKTAVVHNNWDCQHRFASASDLAGDLFNVFAVDEDHIGFFVADVSGHGTSAALQAFSLGLWLAPEHIDWKTSTPADILKAMNERFEDPGDTGQFATVQVGKIACSTGAVIMANAGHPKPIKLHNGGSETIELYTGLPLGIDKECDYQNSAFRLAEDEQLLLFSDGAYEGLNQQQEMFGLSRLQALLTHSLQLGPEALLNRIHHDVYGWQEGELQDDLSLLLLSAPGALHEYREVL